jgi:hypothetical protein
MVSQVNWFWWARDPREFNAWKEVVRCQHWTMHLLLRSKLKKIQVKGCNGAVWVVLLAAECNIVAKDSTHIYVLRLFQGLHMWSQCPQAYEFGFDKTVQVPTNYVAELLSCTTSWGELPARGQWRCWLLILTSFCICLWHCLSDERLSDEQDNSSYQFRYHPNLK